MEKTNEQILEDFEKSCNMSLEEWMAVYTQEQLLKESNSVAESEVLEVDDIDEYMESLGFSTLERIKEKYNL